MRVYRFAAPYKSSGRTQFPESKGKTGCYLIKENDRLVYVGYSASNLYKTLYRHFEQWNHRVQEVVTYWGQLSRKRYTVRIIYCTASQAARLEKMLIIKYRPRDNENKYRNHEINFQDRKTLDAYEMAIIELKTPDF